TGWAILVSEDQWQKLPQDLQEAISTAMTEMQEEAFSTYGDYIANAQKKLDELKAQVWEAPQDLVEQLNAPQYADPAFSSWKQRAQQIGFDADAYIAKVRE